MAAILPLAESVLLGGVDGALRAADVKAGRKSSLQQWGTWFEAGLVAVGAIASMNRVHPDYWEPAVIGGLAMLGQRGGGYLSHQAGIGGEGGPYQPTGALGGPARGAKASHGLPSPAYHSTRLQPAGSLG